MSLNVNIEKLCVRMNGVIYSSRISDRVCRYCLECYRSKTTRRAAKIQDAGVFDVVRAVQLPKISSLLLRKVHSDMGHDICSFDEAHTTSVVCPNEGSRTIVCLIKALKCCFWTDSSLNIKVK